MRTSRPCSTGTRNPGTKSVFVSRILRTWTTLTVVIEQSTCEARCNDAGRACRETYDSKSLVGSSSRRRKFCGGRIIRELGGASQKRVVLLLLSRMRHIGLFVNGRFLGGCCRYSVVIFETALPLCLYICLFTTIILLYNMFTVVMARLLAKTITFQAATSHIS